MYKTDFYKTAQSNPPSVHLALELSSHATHTQTKLTAKPCNKELLVSMDFTQTLPRFLVLGQAP